MSAPGRLAEPRPVAVSADRYGVPVRVAGRTAEHIRETWVVEDRWWDKQPVRRRYWELVSSRGELMVIYRNLATGRWYRQQ